MPQLHCICGSALDGADQAHLVAATATHMQQVHPDFQATPAQVAEFVTLGLRQTGGTVRLPVIGTPVIEPLSPARLADYVQYFDHEAFADNPAWASCYCLFPYWDGSNEAWGDTTWQENRTGIEERIRDGRARGYLAYVDGKVAGWCNAAPRALLSNFDRRPEFAVDDAEQVGAIACFVIAPPYRRHGIARQLLDAAVAGFTAEGLRAVEAYPTREGKGDAHNFHGPLAMYLAAGFEIVRETERQLLVRRRLG